MAMLSMQRVIDELAARYALASNAMQESDDERSRA